MEKVKTKQEYLKELKKNLSSLDKGEIDEIFLDYEGHFSEGLKSGRSEEDLCDSLGDPKTIAKQMKVGVIVKKAEFDRSATNIIRALLAGMGLGFFNLVFIIGPFLGLLGVLVGLLAASLAIFFAGLISFFVSLATLISPDLFTSYVGVASGSWTLMFTSIGLAALGNLMLIGSWYVAKWFYIIIIKYLKLNLKVIIGKK